MLLTVWFSYGDLHDRNPAMGPNGTQGDARKRVNSPKGMLCLLSGAFEI
jgi:hypothetical protein